MKTARAIALSLIGTAVGLSLLSLVAVPTPVSAQADEKISLWPAGYWGDSQTGLISCRPQGILQRDASGKPIQNEAGIPQVKPGTACNICHVFLTAKRLIYFGLSILLFILAPVMLLYGGFLMLTAGGSHEKVSHAMKVFSGTGWGLAFGIGGFLIINTFFSFLAPVVAGKQFKLNWSNINCAELQQYNFGQYEYQAPTGGSDTQGQQP